jgi:hypothetical protein
VAENLGFAEVTVVPDAKAFGATLQKQIAAPLKGAAAAGPVGKLNSLMTSVRREESMESEGSTAPPHAPAGANGPTSAEGDGCSAFAPASFRRGCGGVQVLPTRRGVKPWAGG